MGGRIEGKWTAVRTTTVNSTDKPSADSQTDACDDGYKLKRVKKTSTTVLLVTMLAIQEPPVVKARFHHVEKRPTECARRPGAILEAEPERNGTEWKPAVNHQGQSKMEARRESPGTK